MTPSEKLSFLFQIHKIHKRSGISVCRTGMCWVKRLKIVCCVFYHWNTDYWTPWNFKKDLSPSGNIIAWWQPQHKGGTATLPWNRKQKRRNRNKKNVSFLYTLLHSSLFSWRVSSWRPQSPDLLYAILNLFHIALKESAQCSSLNKHPLQSSPSLFAFQASCHLPSVTQVLHWMHVLCCCS